MIWFWTQFTIPTVSQFICMNYNVKGGKMEGSEYTVTFEAEDFEQWWLAGMDRTKDIVDFYVIHSDDKLTSKDKRELFENCLSLARVGQGRMTQTHKELRHAINQWAAAWNSKVEKGAK